MHDWIRLGFEYDLWANQKWEAEIAELGIEEQARPVMSHILAAQARWLERCGASCPATAEDQNQAFLDLARSRDLDEVIEYRTMAGMACSNTLQEILLHVINHGTYHRGQLRGMVDPAKTDLIPETDLFYFLPGRGWQK